MQLFILLKYVQMFRNYVCIHTTHVFILDSYYLCTYIFILYTYAILIVQVLCEIPRKIFLHRIVPSHRVQRVGVEGAWSGETSVATHAARMTVNGDAKIVFRPSGHLSVRY